MSLKEQLDARTALSKTKASPETLQALAEVDRHLCDSGMLDRALKAGDRAPGFRLFDTRGNTILLADLLRAGPAVLAFFRGDWCAFCSLQLRALAEIQPQVASLGATLVAISPQASDYSKWEDGRDGLPFPTLSDPGAKTAAAYGIAYTLPAEVRGLYAAAGHMPSTKNAATGWLLPLPATYVVDTDGQIVLAFLDTDYRHRLEPAQILTALTCLRSRRSS